MKKSGLVTILIHLKYSNFLYLLQLNPLNVNFSAYEHQKYHSTYDKPTYHLGINTLNPTISHHTECSSRT